MKLECEEKHTCLRHGILKANLQQFKHFGLSSDYDGQHDGSTKLAAVLRLYKDEVLEENDDSLVPKLTPPFKFENAVIGLTVGQ